MHLIEPESHFDVDLNRHGVTVHRGVIESPFFYCLNCFFVEPIADRTCNPYIMGQAVGAYNQPEHGSALDVFLARLLGIAWIRMLDDVRRRSARWRILRAAHFERRRRRGA